MKKDVVQTQWIRRPTGLLTILGLITYLSTYGKVLMCEHLGVISINVCLGLAGR